MESFTKVGIDPWSMLLYLVNFGVLFAVLGLLVIPKIKNLLDERRNSIASDLEASAKLKEDLTRTLTESEEKVKALKAEMVAQKAELEKEFKQRHETMMQQVRTEREELLNETREKLNEEKKNLLTSAKADIVTIVQHAVKAMLAEASTKEVEKSLDDAWKLVEK